MVENQLFTAKQWEEITQKVEAQGHYLLSTPGSFAMFAEKDRVTEFYLVPKEVECSVCKQTVRSAYHQWKKDNWYPVCQTCFNHV